MKKYSGPLMLFSAALIWGSSFIVMKNAVDFLTPSVLLLVRFILASIILTVMFYKPLKQFPRDKVKGGLICGCCLFTAYYVQTIGLSYTTPGKNAFLTAVYVAMVPFFAWAIYRQKPDLYNFIAAFLSIIGIGLVSLDGDLSSINIGDVLTLIGGILYALHIILIKAFSKDLNGGAFTTLQFYSATVCAFIVSLLVEDISIISQIKPNIFFQIFYLAFFATGLCMLFQTMGQQRTSECNASLILSLESVFGVLFSVIFYKEVLTLKIVLGFIVIFIAIIISETKLSFLHKTSKVLMIVCLLLSMFTMSKVNAESDWGGIASPYAYVIDITTNQTLYDKNGDTKIYPASMTKVMTALVALDNMEDLSTTVTVTDEDLEGLYEAEASTANFEVGEQVTYKDLIYGMLLPSGADACRVAARVLFGSEDDMVTKMNEKAEALNLSNTHFENTTGLHDDNHYTTVKDMAIITQEALKNETFKEVFCSRSYNTEISNHYMAATILKFYWHTKTGISHIVGCKTGYTDEAKSCITALVQSQDQDIVCVFAKEESSANYVADCKSVVTYCDNNYKLQTLYSKGEQVSTIKVKGGVEKEYSITVPSDINLFLESDYNSNDYTLEYSGVEEVEAPTTLNEKLGKINLKYQEQVLSSYSVKMEKEIDSTFFTKLIHFIFPYFIVGLLIVVVILYILAHYIRYRIRKERRRRRRERQRRGY